MKLRFFVLLLITCLYYPLCQALTVECQATRRLNNDLYQCSLRLSCQEQEEAIYKEWLRCSVMHHNYELVEWKVQESPENRYVHSFKKNKLLYPGACSLAILFRKKNRDEKEGQDIVPLAVAAMMVGTNGKNRAVTRVLRLRMQQAQKKGSVSLSEKPTAYPLSQKPPVVKNYREALDADWYERMKKGYWYSYVAGISMMIMLLVLLFAISSLSFGIVFRCLIILACGLLPLHQPIKDLWHHTAIVGGTALGVLGLVMIIQGGRRRRYAQLDRLLGIILIGMIGPLVTWWWLPVSGIM